MYEVFIGDIPLLFTDNSNHLGLSDIRILDTMPGPALIEDFLQSGYSKALVYISEDPSGNFSKFLGQFKTIPAAGGFVKSEKGNFLMIHRKGKWDLPKGKIDVGESAPVAAVREVLEETGVGPARIIGPMPSTWHMFMLKGTPVVKHTWWYAMEISGQPKPVPEEKEDILKAKWVKPHKIAPKLDDSYAAIARLIRMWLGTISSR